MHQLYVLYENATGYALFRTTEFEEIALFLPQVKKSILDISKFRSIVFLTAFHSFESIKDSFENMKSILEGQIHMDLQLFLENNIPKASKSRQTVVLGVADPSLASSITDALGISCLSSGVVPEIIRGIRFHLRKLIKGYKDQNVIIKSQLGLAHQHARSKLNMNVDNFDKLIIESVSTSDQLEKDINTVGHQIRHLFSCHFPELSTIVSDNELYIKCVKEIKNRKSMPENIEDTLLTVLNDSEKVLKIVKAAETSMGMEIAEEDMKNIEESVERAFSLMKCWARLISRAGGLIALAKLPGSTVQVLGAEKSLFRAMKTKGVKSSDFSSIKNSAVIGKSIKGRSSRYLANKCSLAARIDCFSVKSESTHGEALKDAVEQQVRFYETGKFGPVQCEMTEERKAAAAAKKALRRKRKKERRRQKLSLKQPNGCLSSSESDVKTTESDIKISESNANTQEPVDKTFESDVNIPEPVKQKNEKRKSTVLVSESDETPESDGVIHEPVKQKNKRKSTVLSAEEDESCEEDQNVQENGIKKTPKLKKKRKSMGKINS
ncbi:nucleolar protein 56 [Caerostris extrusa]|uniref:Nucleolar protein 56 n=1 Tax=Caerostris extrusa TaxID=172846 RepID=A0AAV4SJE6_CAEEX|nr:nucleolar protein 56 [Caerostris extrusa]